LVDGRPQINQHRSSKTVPAETPTSKAISKALKAEGFRFVGPTTVYAFMQATGMVNDHLVDCHRHEPCAACSASSRSPGAQARMTERSDSRPETGRAAASLAAHAVRAAARPARSSPRDIEIEDIAHGLARVARWNGQTVGEHAFSVAQHALLVEEIATAMQPISRAAGSWRRCCTMRPST
jgi:hypothetical protein